MARILFVVPPLTGHVNPTVSVAAELARRGHEVAWVGHPGKVRPLLPAGARLFELDDRVPAELLARTQEKAGRVRGLEGLRFLWEDFLIPLARAMRPAVEEVADAFRPGLLVVDQQALGGTLVARARGLRWATFATTSASVVEPLLDLPKVLAWRDERIAELEREAGLEPVAEPDRSPSLVVVFSTLALVGEARPFPAHYAFVGPSMAEWRAEVPFPWEELREGPRLLVSLGTVNAERGGRFFRALAEGLAGEALQVVLVASTEVAGALPGNVLRRDFVPQLELLPRMDAVVCHGGHNTTCEALWHGLPLVVAPIKDDQPVVAAQVEAAGAGLRVKFGRASAETLRSAVLAVLREARYREGARRIAASFREAGGPGRAADLLEGLL